MSVDLACSRCGAPLPPDAASTVATCAYCGATAVPSPRVVERVVERILVATAPLGADGERRCPRCAEELREARSGEKVVRGCPRCGGMWIDNATVEQLSNAHDAELEDVARRLVPFVAHSPRRSPEIACPECHGSMRRSRLADTMHAIDVCDAHGTWFDRDELSTFVRAFAEQRAGEIDDEDLAAAGVPGHARGSDSGDGFFTNLFSLLK
jgi:Zn-finger nucleic acid-binding protein/DNA-directed RNA polymerase subunit RPC12/RpoP